MIVTSLSCVWVKWIESSITGTGFEVMLLFVESSSQTSSLSVVEELRRRGIRSEMDAFRELSWDVSVSFVPQLVSETRASEWVIIGLVECIFDCSITVGEISLLVRTGLGGASALAIGSRTP